MSDVNEDMLLSDGDTSDITDRRVTETGKSLTDRPHGPTVAAVSNVDQSDISQSLHAIKGFMANMSVAFTSIANGSDNTQIPCGQPPVKVSKVVAARGKRARDDSRSQRPGDASHTTDAVLSDCGSQDMSDDERSLLNVAKTNSGDSSSQTIGQFDAILDDFDNDYDDECTGPVVSDKVASLCNKRFGLRMAVSKVKARRDKYPRPANCENMLAPKINAPVKNSINRYNRGRDLRMVNVQKTIVSAATEIAETVDHMLTSKSPDGETIVSKLTDSMALLGHANYDVSLRRREILRPCIQEQYRPLCGDNVPVTNYLFGDDLQNEMKTVLETSRIGKSVSKSWPKGENSFRRNRGHFQGHGQSRYHGTFLEKTGYRPNHRKRNQKNFNSKKED